MEPIQGTAELTLATSGPDKYVRIHLERVGGQWRYETTVSLRWSDEDCPYVDELGELNRDAAALAREEIGRREKADARASGQEIGS